MPNLKAIISKNVGSTLTAAYTNSTGQDAALKAFNVNHIGNATEIASVTPAGGTSGFLGNSVPFIDFSGSGRGIPYCVKLTDNKLLLLTNVNYLYNSSDLFVEAEVVEWTGTQYVNYQTTRLNANIGALVFNGANATGLQINGVALTDSKVALVFNSNLYVLTITNNVVDSTLQSVAVNSIFNNIATKIAPVPGNTNKVVLYGVSGANYVLQAYNVPTGSAPTVAGSTQTVMAYSGGMPFDFCLHRRTDPTYFCAGGTNSTSFSGSILTFNDSTNAWTVAAATTQITATNIGSTVPLITVPLSTDGSSSYYTAVIMGNTLSSGGDLRVFAQTSGTSISTTLTTSTNSTSNQRNGNVPLYYYNLGSRKALICSAANGVYGYSDAGSLTNLMSSAGQEDIVAPNLVLPFSDRPLYYVSGTSSAYANLMGRTGLTDTGFGTFTTTGNYIAYGQPNGKSYAWSDSANCWFAVQGETLYALSITGEILAELKLNIKLGNSDRMTCKVISIAPDGRIGILSDSYGVGTQSVYSLSGTVSASVQLCFFTLVRVSGTGAGITSPSQLVSSAVANTQFTSTSSPRKAGDLLLYVDSGGVTRYLTVGWGNAGTTSQFTASTGTVAAPATVVNSATFSTGNTSPDAYYTNAQLFLTSPTVSGSADPNVIYIGSSFAATASNKTGFLSYTTTPVVATNPSNGAGIITVTTLGNSLTESYIPCVSRSQSGMSAVFGGTPNTNSLYLWLSMNNTALVSNYTISSMTGALKPFVLAVNNMTAITNGASGTSAITPFVQYWASVGTTPAVTLNATSSTASSVNMTRAPDKYSISVNGFGLNATYAAYGQQNTTFTMAINNGTDDFYVTPVAGTSILIGNQYRNTDVYYVPAGGSVKIQAGIPRQMDVMLEVLEQ